MSYNPADKFPGAQPQRVIDLETIVEALDPSQEVPVVYTFGAGAPTSLVLNGREIMAPNLLGSISSKLGVAGASGRFFIEFVPYK